MLVLPGPPPATTSGNLVLDGLLGAEIVWVGDGQAIDDAQAALDAAALDVAARLRDEGRTAADRVLGVDTGATSDPRERVARLLGEMGAPHLDPARLRLRTDQVGDGYATLPGPTADALVLAARTEGLVLDPVYSARALAGLIAEVEDGGVGEHETVVFVATGGLPGLFGSPGTTALAEDALRRAAPGGRAG